MSLLSVQQIKERFDNAENFEISYSTLGQSDGIDNLLPYLIKRFNLGGDRISKDQATTSIKNSIYDGRRYHPDSDIYLGLRNLQEKNLGKKVTEVYAREEENKMYRQTLVDKAKFIDKDIRLFDSNGLKGKRVLDIGTENLYFLDEMEKLTGKTVYGINIDTGFCHYEDEFKTNVSDPRFQLYDGYNIPFPPNSFDVVTLFSVIHHIPDEGLGPLIKDIRRVCSGYVYFKDVDLTTKPLQSMCQIQHDVYEGVMVPGDKSYINLDVTKNKVLTAFQREGFKILNIEEIPNFNHTYYALLYNTTSGVKRQVEIPTDFIWEKDIYKSSEIESLYNSTWKQIDVNFTISSEQIKHFEGKKWLQGYEGTDLTIVVDPNIEKQTEIVTDYFVERERMGCNRAGFLSPVEFLKKEGKQWQPLYIQKNQIPLTIQEKAIALKDSIAEAMRYQLCATFPWSVCKSIFDRFNPKKILDMCAGWGDRLLSAIAYGADKYVGVDPNSALKDKYQEMIQMFGDSRKQRCITKAFEDVTNQDIPSNEMFDLMFTSPPYFTAEQYSKDPSQAYVRYPTLESWLEGFMYRSINIAWKHLEEGGHFMFVLNDTRDTKFTAKVLEHISSQSGSEYKGMIKYMIKDTKIVQPIWIFQRKKSERIEIPIESKKMELEVISRLIQGKVYRLQREENESDKVFEYRCNHSCNQELEPLKVGRQDTYQLLGMDFSQTNGYRPSDSNYIRKCFEQAILRKQLISYISEFVNAEDTQIIPMIGKNQSDMEVIANLNTLPRKYGKVPIVNIPALFDVISSSPRIDTNDILEISSGEVLLKTLSSNITHYQNSDKKLDSRTNIFPKEWDGRFSLILLLGTLSCRKYPQFFIEEIKRVLAPGGIVVVQDVDYIDITSLYAYYEQKWHVDGFQGHLYDVNIPNDILGENPYPDPNGINPYRIFLDAISIISSELRGTKYPIEWKLYRSLLEWNTMFSSLGLNFYCSVSPVVEKQMKIGNEWMETNASRTFLMSFGKLGTGMGYRRIYPQYNLASLFPKIGGKEGTFPTLEKGIHYDDKYLSSIIPWNVTNKISREISNLVTAKLGAGKKYRIFDGTPGLGINLLPLIGNWDINEIVIVDTDTNTSSMLKTNLQMYTKKNIYPTGMNTYKIDVDNKKIILGTEDVLKSALDESIYNTVLFLNFTQSRCSSKDITYLEMPLNVVVEKFARKGGIVVARIPDNLQFREPNETIIIDGYKFYVLDRNLVQFSKEEEIITVQEITEEIIEPEPIDMTMTSSSLANECIRYILMQYLRKEFIRIIYNNIIPEKKSDDYYMWVFEVIKSYGTGLPNACSDPLIPYTPEPIRSRMITMEPFWNSTYLPYDTKQTINIAFIQNEIGNMVKGVNKLPKDIRDKELPGIKKLSSLKTKYSGTERQNYELHREYALFLSSREQEKVDGWIRDIHAVTKKIYDKFKSLENDPKLGANVNVKDDGDSKIFDIRINSALNIEINNILTEYGFRAEIPKITLLKTKYGKFRGVYGGSNFDGDLATMLLRYSSMMNVSKEAKFAGTNLHAALPPNVFQMLQTNISVSMECFASPLNATLDKFLSAFPDTDIPFGSQGSFFTYEFSTDGSYEANPPFTEDMFMSMTTRLNTILEEGEQKGLALSFFVIVSAWEGEEMDILYKNKWSKFSMRIEKESHKYIGGQQHLQSGEFSASFDTYATILQTTKGNEKYPIPTNMNVLIKNTFK